MRLEVFKSGQHPDLTAEAVQQVVADYDPALHKAPLTIGHVSSSKAPAWGWANTLAFDEPSMAGEFGDVDSDFETLWNNGHYRNISAAFYPPGHPDNPLSQIGKSGYYPHHFAVLGGKAPKIKGLKNPDKLEAALAFDEGDLSDLVVVEFAEPNPQEPEAEHEIIENAEVDAWSLARFMRGIRDYIIERDGVEMADRVAPEFYIEQMDATASQQMDEVDAAMPTFSEGDNPMSTDLEAREADLRERETKLRRTELTQFCETDLAKKIHPSQRARVVELLVFMEAAAAADDSQLLTFSEDDKEQKLKPVEALKGLLTKLPDLVEFSELGGGGLPPEVTPMRLPEGAQVSESSDQLHGQILAFCEAHNLDPDNPADYNKALIEVAN
ncbi:MAG: hypothetical protein ACFB0C_15645 [Leptolyngbyaceae cyanobacterium]